MALPVIGGVIAALSSGTLVKTSIAWFVANVACKLIFRTIFSLGFGVIAYAGADALFDYVITLIQTQMGALPISLRGVFDALNVDRALGIMVAAGTYTATLRFATRMGYRGRPQGIGRVW